MSIAMSLALLAVATAPAPEGRHCRADGIQQLRIYEIFEGNKAAFHARFRDHGQRIMKRHGFDILAMWEANRGDRTEFVYVLQWPNEELMKQRWQAFMADEEWSRIKRETAAKHGQLVGNIEERVLKRTEYSPCQGGSRRPGTKSLWLLPSGPDQVGDSAVRRLPSAHMG